MQVTQEKRKMMISDQEQTVTVTRRIGRAVYETPRGPVEADECTEIDYGPRTGISRVFTLYNPEATPADTDRIHKKIGLMAGELAAGL